MDLQAVGQAVAIALGILFIIIQVPAFLMPYDRLCSVLIAPTCWQLW